jgi:uncharacterized protein with gpF-like domain
VKLILEIKGRINSLYTYKTAENLRKICGKSAENLRKICGQSAENLRKICGKSAENLRKIYGRSAENLRKICGKSAENLRTICGKSAEYLRNNCGTSVCNQKAATLLHAPPFKRLRPEDFFTLAHVLIHVQMYISAKP